MLGVFTAHVLFLNLDGRFAGDNRVSESVASLYTQGHFLVHEIFVAITEVIGTRVKNQSEGLGSFIHIHQNRGLLGNRVSNRARPAYSLD
jgi:hypothetical protein